MKVKILKPTFIKGERVGEGSLLDVDPRVARYLVMLGRAAYEEAAETAAPKAKK